jgi:hypothetical protein
MLFESFLNIFWIFWGAYGIMNPQWGSPQVQGPGPGPSALDRRGCLIAACSSELLGAARNWMDFTRFSKFFYIFLQFFLLCLHAFCFLPLYLCFLLLFYVFGGGYGFCYGILKWMFRAQQFGHFYQNYEYSYL